MNIGSAAPSSAEATFRERLAQVDHPDVLELGTLRWEADRPTHHQSWAPHAGHYVKSDIAAGVDVDIVADAHDLTDVFAPRSFDALIAVSVFEHLARPWIAADQIATIVRPGGVILIATHQTFPLHGYPHDYFRFSTEALQVLFAPPAWSTLTAGYAYPCTIEPPRDVTRWNRAAQSFLNVEACFLREG